MRLDIFNIRDFIKKNDLVPVTNPIAISATKMPTPDGIFSYEIFGYTTEERKNTFSYIDLHEHFFHPECLKVINRMGSLGKIATGEKYAIVKNKKIEIVNKDADPNAKTGVDFYYDNWDQIEWLSESDMIDDDDDISMGKKTRLKFFKHLGKDEAFVTAWLVIPPYYRDMNTDDLSLGDDINKLYNNLLSMTKALRTGFGYDWASDAAKERIQNIINMLFDMTLTPVTGKSVDVKDNGTLKGNAKRSVIRRNLVGRDLDFSSSSVITSPVSSTTSSVKDFVKYGTMNLPLQSAISMAKPFFITYMQWILEDYANDIKTLYGLKTIDTKTWSTEYIDKALTRFVLTGSNKDDIVTISGTDRLGNKREVAMVVQESKSADMKNAVVRSATYLDLVYWAAVEICKDKYSLNTRYPIANHQNIYAAKVNVVSTNRTRDIYIKVGHQDRVTHYEHYPYISWVNMGEDMVDPDKKPEPYYGLYRVTVIGNGVIRSLGADYDGDTMMFRMLFTKEANAEAEKLIWQKTNFFNANGGLSRGITQIGKDCIIGLYALTKD